MRLLKEMPLIYNTNAIISCVTYEKGQFNVINHLQKQRATIIYLRVLQPVFDHFLPNKV